MKNNRISSNATKLLPPLMVGDHVVLDFLNSVATPKSESIEWLGDGEQLLDWFEQAQLVKKSEALAHFDANAFIKTAENARLFREEIRAALAAKADGHVAKANNTARRALNKIFSSDNRFSEIICDHDGCRVQRRHRWQQPDEIFLPLADAVADLFCYGDFTHIRKCENPKCSLWFYDRTKGHRRRWCTTTICGNRAKVAAHRARKKHP